MFCDMRVSHQLTCDITNTALTCDRERPTSLAQNHPIQDTVHDTKEQSEEEHHQQQQTG
jgi:hypothetical protein